MDSGMGSETGTNMADLDTRSALRFTDDQTRATWRTVGAALALLLRSISSAVARPFSADLTTPPPKRGDRPGMYVSDLHAFFSFSGIIFSAPGLHRT